MTLVDFIHVFYDPPLVRSITAGAIGLCVGSFLNVLALRTLEEKSIISPGSHCRKCKHPLSQAELIPVLSYFLLKGKCKHCSAAIAWYYPFVEAFTALTFVVLVNFFQNPVQLVGMLFFSCTLITVCITDFKEKLIPHEITYPSIVIGIAYSATKQNGIPDAFIGIGISYILFDFLAFYGLKFYLWKHKNDDDAYDGEARQAKDKKVVIDRDKESMMVVGPDDEVDAHLDHVLLLEDGSEKEEEEEFEVMGGGDAVLAAVIAAWLGWQYLIGSLLVGFMAGAVMGSFYLAHELHLQNKLRKCLIPVSIGMTIGIVVIEGFLLFMNYLNGWTTPGFVHYLAYGAVGAVCGGVLGALFSGTNTSKSFPFGPGLAVGAAAGMFMAKYTFIFGGP